MVNHQLKHPLGIPTRKLDRNIEVDFRETVYEDSVAVFSVHALQPRC
jgi:hypothetical protein